jgi:cysteinyl-tRNA synthetase
MAANIFFQTFTKILYGHYIRTPNLYCYPACPAAVNNSLMQLVASTPFAACICRRAKNQDNWGMTIAAHTPANPTLKLFNSLTGRKELFVPADPKRVTLYVCGPTVYDYAHIGNARSAVVFDVLFRLLRDLYGADGVVYARNITDVDDKIIARFQEQRGQEQQEQQGQQRQAGNQTIDQLTDFYAAAYNRDLAALGCLPPTMQPRARESMPAIIALIQRLLDRGHAYVAEGHVLFAVKSFADYGQLAKRRLEEMVAGARVEVAPYKQDPCDFVLWKPSPPIAGGSFDSPWGHGRPGWHSECSAMIAAVLGNEIDIHAGGADLKFPHHENEIAQSRCAHDTPVLAHTWLHNGFLTVGGEKMSKSLGNFRYAWQCWRQTAAAVDDAGDAVMLLRQPQAVRLQLLSAHYRQPLNWPNVGDRGIEPASQHDGLIEDCYRLFHQAGGASGDTFWQQQQGVVAAPDNPVRLALLDDLNTPLAISRLTALYQQARGTNGKGAAEGKEQALIQLLAAGQLLGLFADAPSAFFTRKRIGFLSGTIKAKSGATGVLSGVLSDKQIVALLHQRQTARAARDFAAADAIKQTLTSHDVLIQDTPDGTTLYKRPHDPDWRTG